MNESKIASFLNILENYSPDYNELPILDSILVGGNGLDNFKTTIEKEIPVLLNNWLDCNKSSNPDYPMADFEYKIFIEQDTKVLVIYLTTIPLEKSCNTDAVRALCVKIPLIVTDDLVYLNMENGLDIAILKGLKATPCTEYLNALMTIYEPTDNSYAITAIAKHLFVLLPSLGVIEQKLGEDKLNLALHVINDSPKPHVIGNHDVVESDYEDGVYAFLLTK